MFGDKIEDLEKLLSEYLGKSKSIIDTKITRLTAPGENYGGTLLKVDITLKNNTADSKEELHTVAKLIPDQEFVQKIFNVQLTCKLEIAFYDIIVPTLQQFQRDRGVQQVVNFVAKKYGSRLNLDGSETVDENAVLLLDNLTEKGFENVSRFESFDLPTIKIILKDLAAFHAVPLAIKLQEPETFATKIKPYVGHKLGPPVGEGKHKNPIEVVFNILENDEECRPLIKNLNREFRGPGGGVCNEPFATMGHGDLWVNNIMVKFEEGKPVESKFVDFQCPTYVSPANDLFFLLWTSVKKEVLDEHFDELLQFYHENFVENLRQLKCDISPFSFDKFLEELKEACPNELNHALSFSCMIIFYDSNAEGGYRTPHERKMEDVPDIAKKRVIQMVKKCKEKGWI